VLLNAFSFGRQAWKNGRTLLHVAPLLVMVAVVFTIVIAMILAFGVSPYAAPSLSLSIDAERPGSIQVFFDTGSGFNEELSGTATYETGSTSLSLPVPGVMVQAIRIDPQADAGHVELGVLFHINLS
jgi:hypothetical protein